MIGAGKAQVELAAPATITAEFGDAAADPAGRPEYLAGVELKVGSLARTAERLGGVEGVRVERDRIIVPARAAFNATLMFTG